MANDSEARTLATALRAAVLLRHFTETRHIYGDVPDKRTALELHELLVGQIDSVVEGRELPFDWKAERPHFENTSDHVIAWKVVPVLFLLLSRALNCGADELEKVKEFQSKHALPPIPEVEQRIQELLTFDCRIPLERAGAAFVGKERALFILGKYWDFYHALLQQHGSAPVGFTPHPLLRFIVNARARIRHCLEMIGDPSLSEPIEEALGICFDQDTSTVWEEWGQPVTTRATEAYEEARLGISGGGFTLTEAERLFLESGHAQLKDLDQSAQEEMRKLIARVRRAHPERHAGSSEPMTCFEWIRRVELTLRELVMSEAQGRYGNNWPSAVEKQLGTAAVSARDTMKQRGVGEAEDILHFTQLADVVAVISANFSSYAPRLGMTKKQFNSFLAPILKGRTEEAHNRPERLWPEIEQQRVRLACHDLLRLIADAQKATGDG